MANISLKDIQFPGLNNVYKVPEVDSTLTQSGAAADAKKTGDELSDLKQELSQLVDGEEILIPTPTMTMGTIDSNTGEASTSTTGKEWITDFVEADDLVKLIASSDGNGAYYKYDSEKTFISRITFNSGSTNTISNTGYYRFYVHKNNWGVIDEATARSYITLKEKNKIDQRIDACESKLDSILYRSVSEIKEGLFEKGNIYEGHDDTYGSANRIRTSILYALNDIAISALVNSYANARVSTHTFDETGTFIADSGWLASVTIPKGTIFRLLCSYDITTISTAKTVSEVFACFTFESRGEVSDVFQLDNVKFLFEHGTINNTNGNNDTFYGNARGRMINKTVCKSDLVIHVKGGVIAIAYYESDDTFIGQTGWLTSDKMISANQKFRIMVTPNPNVSTYYSLDDIVACIEFEEVDGQQYGLNPNIIWQCRNVDDSFYPPYSKWYIQAAAKNQYDRVRFNIRKTTDGYYFLCHDDTINQEARNSDGTSISSTVNANGQTLATLNSYDWGIKYGAQYAGAGVPLLEDALFYASLYNVSVSVEFASLSDWTDTDTANCLALFDKYGVTDNLIVIDPYGAYFTFLKKFVQHNQRISIFLSATEENFNADATITGIGEVQTPYNKVYAQLLPWGTSPTNTFIAFAKEHNLVLYNSIVMSKSDLLDDDTFSGGFGLIEANNVYMIKDTVRAWADSKMF